MQAVSGRLKGWQQLTVANWIDENISDRSNASLGSWPQVRWDGGQRWSRVPDDSSLSEHRGREGNRPEPEGGRNVQFHYGLICLEKKLRVQFVKLE